MKPSIVYFGTPGFSVTVLDALRKENYPIAGVVTTPDRPKGRKGTLTPSPVKLYAQENHLQIFDPASLKNNNTIVKQLRALEPTLFIVFSYGKIIPDELLAIPQKGSLNIHPSLLPKYRGPSPVQGQILGGETDTGVSIIEMTDKVDAGPIIFQQTMKMPENATFQSLIEVLSELSVNVINTVILGYVDSKNTVVHQDNSKATFTKIITKQDGYVNLHKMSSINPLQLDKMIRAYYPWPTVWMKWQDKVMKLLPNGFIQIEGKSPIPVKQFLHGYPSLCATLEPLYQMKKLERS